MLTENDSRYISGEIHAMTGSLNNLNITGTLAVTGGNVFMGEGVYNSPGLGSQDGILTGNGTMLVSDQGIDFDATAGTGREIEWHDTILEDDLNSNANLLGEISATRNSPTTSSLTIRAQNNLGQSTIFLTATEVEVNARLEVQNLFTAFGGANFATGHDVMMNGYLTHGVASGELRLPVYNDTNRPSNPEPGAIIFNADANGIQVAGNNGNWGGV